MAKNVSQNISKEMIDNIKNYGNQITTLEDFVTSVRLTPGMYIGGIGDPGFINMIREIVQNANDELNKKESPCDTVWVTYDERSFTIIVEDNGRGIPFDNIIRIFRDQHTSSNFNFNKKSGEYSSGLHGVGSKVTNALSKKFMIDSFILGEGRHVEFNDGYPWDKGEVKIPKKDAEGKQGTRVTFQPAMSVMGDLSVTWEDVFNLVKLIHPLNKIGATTHFKGVDSAGKVHSTTLVNNDGIIEYLINDTTKPLVKPIHLFKDTGKMKADVMFTYDMSEKSISTMHAFSNFCPTASGYHIDGFYEGLGYFFSNYMNKIYLAKDTGKKKKDSKKLSVTIADVKTNLCVVIAAAHLEPMFSGQAKERLSNQDMKPFMKGMVMDLLDQWSKENPADFNKICKYLKEVAELRLKADKEKIKITSKYNSSPLSGGLPSKYVAPTGKKDLELWICEGDSAAGTMKNHRLNERQGYFPIRGKISNAFKYKRETFLSNPEVAGIIAIIFDGYKDFDINKLGKKNFKIDVSKIKWKKIIFGTDADSDGKHIDTLLLRFFLLYMPELIEAGMVYAAVPPLYGIRLKNQMVYFIDRIDYVKYIQKEFSKKFSITNINGKKLTASELSKFLYVNIDYTYEVNRISKRYSIDPSFLESILILRDNSPKVIEKKLKKLYRFTHLEVKSGVPVISSVVNDKTQTVYLTQRLIDDCIEIINILNKNKEYSYIMNNNVCGIYDIMNTFDNETPNNIERYKGLGEMSGQKLFESTLNPENRTLIQYTLDDAKAAVEEIRYYENNLYELVKTAKVSRFDVLD